MNTFAITGTGRCGTKFLSTHMNKSKTWTVLHEPTSPPPPQRFQQEYYGEVNGCLVHNPEVFLNLEVDKKGIIFRDPITLLTSIFNRKSHSVQIHYIDKVIDMYTIFDNWLESYPDWIKIQFEQMVSDYEYLVHLFYTFGIKDVDITSINLNNKINTNGTMLYHSIEDWPKNSQDYFLNSKLTQYAYPKT